MIRMKWMGSDGEVWSVCSAIWNWYHVTMVGNMNILTGSPATTYHHMDLRRFLSEVPCHHITWQPSQYGLSTFFDPTKPNPGNLMSCTLFFGKGHVWRYTYIQIFRWYTHYQIFRFKSMTIEHVWTTCCLQAFSSKSLPLTAAMTLRPPRSQGATRAVMTRKNDGEIRESLDARRARDPMDPVVPFQEFEGLSC